MVFKNLERVHFLIALRRALVVVEQIDTLKHVPLLGVPNKSEEVKGKPIHAPYSKV